ncbi:YehR family lipoprotein, partial [Escherichia coli]
YKNIAGVEEKLTDTDTYAQENAKKGITMAQMELVMKAAGFKEVK